MVIIIFIIELIFNLKVLVWLYLARGHRLFKWIARRNLLSFYIFSRRVLVIFLSDLAGWVKYPTTTSTYILFFSTSLCRIGVVIFFFSSVRTPQSWCGLLFCGNTHTSYSQRRMLSSLIPVSFHAFVMLLVEC